MFKTVDSRRVCIGLVTDHKDDILMGRRNDNKKFTLPGGCAEKGEDPHYCMIREFKEETGLDIADMKLVGAHWDKDHNLLLYLFKITINPNQEIDTSKDPDQEVPMWYYTNPNNVVEELDVPLERNIALQYWIKN